VERIRWGVTDATAKLWRGVGKSGDHWEYWSETEGEHTGRIALKSDAGRISHHDSVEEAREFAESIEKFKR
jgi:hypothetical protein